jgi:hypothetical protein
MRRVDLEIDDANPQKVGCDAVQGAEAADMPLRGFEQTFFVPVPKDETEAIAFRDDMDALHAAGTNQFS